MNSEEIRHRVNNRDKFINDLCGAVRTTHIIITNKRINNNVKNIEFYVDKITKLCEDLTIVQIYSLFKKLGTHVTSKYDITDQKLTKQELRMYNCAILGPTSSLRHYMSKKIKQFRHAFQLSQFKRFMTGKLPVEILDFERNKYGEELSKPNRTDRDVLAYITEKSRCFFKHYEVPTKQLLGCTTKACLEGKSNYLFTIGEGVQLPQTIKELDSYRSHIDEVSDNLIKKAINNNTTVRYVQVQEPMKVRSLTAMPSHHQILKGIQRSLKKFIDRDQSFRLTNNPDIHTAVKEMNWPTDLIFTSGDYSAATDTIHRSAVIAAISGIKCNHLERSLIMSSFDNFTIVDSEDNFLLNQKNGQLMGSILSFPILCLINKWIYQYTQEMSQERSTDPLINGDDILFKSTKLFHEEWKVNIQKVGFKPSPGKNFLQKSNFTINSRPFSYDRKSNSYIKLPFINGKEFHTYNDLHEYTTALKNNTIKESVKQNLHFCRDLNLKLKNTNRTRQQTLLIHKDSSTELGGCNFSIGDTFTKVKKAYQRVYIKKSIKAEFSPPDLVSDYLTREGYPTLFNVKELGKNLLNCKQDIKIEIRKQNLSIIEQILRTYTQKKSIDRIKWMTTKISKLHQVSELCGHIFNKI